MQSIKVHRTCRLCKYPLTPVLSLGEQYLSDFPNKAGKGLKAPLDLTVCKNCQLVQLRHTVNRDSIYRHYHYHSGTNPVMVNALKEIVDVAVEHFSPKLSGRGIWVDIGANDGTLLRQVPSSYEKVAFEPALNFAKNYPANTKLISDYFTAARFKCAFGRRKAKIITAIAMFYDLDDPHKFVADLATILDREGIIIIQQNYLFSMLIKNAYDNICVRPETLILGDNKRIDEIKAGDFTLGYHGLLSRVVRTMKRQYDGDMIQLQPTYLERLECTPEHPIFVVKKENVRFNCGRLKRQRPFKPEWVNAKDVKHGDYVVMPKLKEHQIRELDLTLFKSKDRHSTKGLLSLPINSDTAWLIGLYVAEGNPGGKPNNPCLNLSLNKTEIAFARRVKQIMNAVGYTATIIHPRTKPSALEVRITCATLARAMPLWCGKGAKNKHVPDFIMENEREIKQAFLRGLFEGDGYIEKERVYLHTASKILALQVQLMAASLGGMLNMAYAKPSDRQKPNGYIIHGGESWQVRGTCKEILGYEKTRQKEQHYSDENFIYVPIKKVAVSHYSGQVHNIETDSDSYLVSNAIVHNCHEHVCYYNLTVLEALLRKHGLETIRVQLNEVNGGSFRTVIAKKDEYPVQANVENLLRYERKCDIERMLRDFRIRIDTATHQLHDFISRETARGKTVIGYGAGNRGNTILQFNQLNPQLIKGIIDANPEKWGKYTVGTNIPIYPPEALMARKPDYLLILPYFYSQYFLVKEQAYLEGGGKFLVPLPEPRLIGLRNGEVYTEAI